LGGSRVDSVGSGVDRFCKDNRASRANQIDVHIVDVTNIGRFHLVNKDSRTNEQVGKRRRIENIDRKSIGKARGIDAREGVRIKVGTMNNGDGQDKENG